MNILTLRLGSLQTNCYILYDEKNKECIVIDPADEPEYIAQKINSLGLKCQAIIATHGHFDHNLAAGKLQLILTSNQKPAASNYIPFYIHKDDLFLLKKMNESANYFIRYNPHAIIPKNINFFEHKMFQVSGFRFQVLHTPGHTPGGICINVTCHISNVKCNILISGDTLFKSGIGRYDFSYSDKNKLFRSLQNIIKLPSDTIVYPGHSDPTTIADEKRMIKELINSL